MGDGAGHGVRPWGGLTATAPHLSAQGAAEGRLTSSRAEMVEAGLPGALAREGLWAGPGQPGESLSPATSWISRARVATSFTSVWLSLQRQERRQVLRGPPGPGLSAGKCGDRNQMGHDVIPPQAEPPAAPPRLGGSPSQEAATGSGAGPGVHSLQPGPNHTQTATSSARGTPTGRLSARPPEGGGGGLGRGPGRKGGQRHPQAPGHTHCSSGHQGHTSPAPQAGRRRQSHCQGSEPGRPGGQGLSTGQGGQACSPRDSLDLRPLRPDDGNTRFPERLPGHPGKDTGQLGTSSLPPTAREAPGLEPKASVARPRSTSAPRPVRSALLQPLARLGAGGRAPASGSLSPPTPAVTPGTGPQDPPRTKEQASTRSCPSSAQGAPQPALVPVRSQRQLQPLPTGAGHSWRNSPAWPLPPTKGCPRPPQDRDPRLAPTLPTSKNTEGPPSNCW